MKKLFYFGLGGLAVFEVLNVYFIMPMPGSQRLNTVDLAYFLYSNRWIFRIVFGVIILAGSVDAFRTPRKWLPLIAMVPVAAIVYVFNFRMTADHMFLQPETLAFKTRAENTLTDSSLVVVVARNMEAKAYPIRYIQYHHQVRDTIAGKEIMVTYCNVCRTGRVFEPLVDGKPETFRLVGMDHFNAMFEDQTTGSWWRQATGEAITGPLKGNRLPEVESSQLTLNTFFALHPFGKVMDAETASRHQYDSLGRFEKGKSKSKLTGTDSLSWRDKSWVLGVEINGKAKAYDWNVLKEQRVLNSNVGSTPIVVALASDDQSFAAYIRDSSDRFVLRNDSLISADNKYDFAGRSPDGTKLPPVNIYQEFWHSWKEFHPDTEVHE